MEENASNALMMAASVLIGLIVLSAFVLLFVSFSNSSARIEERLAETQIKEFNAHYEIYSFSEEENGDATSRVSIYDIVSLINFTKQYNHDLYSKDECEHYNQDSMPYYVEVYIDFASIRNKVGVSSGFKPYQEADKETLNRFMRNAYFDHESEGIGENEDNIYRFYCTGIEYNDITGRVVKIEFRYKEKS